MVLIKNRIINIYVYSTYEVIDDLIWTQNTIKKWLETIVKANPPITNLSSSSYSNRSINWSNVLGTGIAAGLIGLFFSSSKKTKSP